MAENGSSVEEREQQEQLDGGTKEDEVSKGRKRSDKASDGEASGSGEAPGGGMGAAEGGGTAEEHPAQPKKWNLRRNRPMLDFTTMEELNEMDDYDSEDDNDWRPKAGKKRSKSAAQKAGSEEEEEDGSGSEEDDDFDEEIDGEDHGSSGSDKEEKKSKRKAAKSTASYDEELTNDSLSLSQGKNNQVGWHGKPQIPSRSGWMQKVIKINGVKGIEQAESLCLKKVLRELVSDMATTHNNRKCN